jgi:prepilin-type N-terminal cleavage/methylation domain-containing protein
MKKTYDGFSLLELLIVVAIILIIATIAVPSLLRSRQSANEAHAVANLRTITTGEVTYLSTSMGAYGGLQDLISAGLLDFRYSQAASGYAFNIATSPSASAYTASATAVGSSAGRYDYYTTEDYVIRYSTDPTRAPTGLSGEPVR